jgi:D-3-phosphoglycerate dehydrogenase
VRKVLVTCPPMLRQIPRYAPQFARAGFDVFAPHVVQVLPEAQLLELVPQFDGWIIGDDPATAAVFGAGAAGRLRAAVKWGVGVDNVDFGGARRHGIAIDNTPGVFGAEVADLAMHYLTGLVRHVYAIDRGVRAGQWPKPAGRSLSQLTVALVGFGDIGRHFAVRAAAAGIRILVYDPSVRRAGEPCELELKDWPDGLEECDAVVLTASLTPSSRHMVNAETLRRMKPGAYLINVARGGLIDEPALVAALASGALAAAALDVFAVEPLPADSPLRQHPGCVFGSHNGSNTLDAVDRVSRLAIDKLAQFLDP